MTPYQKQLVAEIEADAKALRETVAKARKAGEERARAPWGDAPMQSLAELEARADKFDRDAAECRADWGAE